MSRVNFGAKVGNAFKDGMTLFCTKEDKKFI